MGLESTCDHKNNVCTAFEFKDDLTFEEFVDRFIHWLEGGLKIV